MTDTDALIAFLRAAIDFAGIDSQEFAAKAFWAAGESQKATAIPALTAFAALSLLAVVLWIAIVRLAWGVIVAAIRP